MGVARGWARVGCLRVLIVAGVAGGGQVVAGSFRSRERTSARSWRPGGSRSTGWPAWLVSRPGTAMIWPRRVSIIAFPPRVPRPTIRPCSSRVTVSWCNQPAIVVASSAPHIQAVLISGWPEGRCRRAPPCLLSRKAFSISVRCRYQYSTDAAFALLLTSRSVRMKL